MINDSSLSPRLQQLHTDGGNIWAHVKFSGCFVLQIVNVLKVENIPHLHSGRAMVTTGHHSPLTVSIEVGGSRVRTSGHLAQSAPASSRAAAPDTEICSYHCAFQQLQNYFDGYVCATDLLPLLPWVSAPVYLMAA